MPILLTAATATTAGAQTVDPIFGNGFPPGLTAFIPAFTAAAEGALGTYPMSSGPLRVVLESAMGVDTFVPIASSEPSRLVVVGGGVTVPAGLNNALVTVNALVAGAAPVTVWATLGNTMGAGVRVERALNETDVLAVMTPAGAQPADLLFRNGFEPALNETDLPAEADYCIIQFPPSLTVATGEPTTLIYGRLYETGATENMGAPPGWVAQARLRRGRLRSTNRRRVGVHAGRIQRPGR